MNISKIMVRPGVELLASGDERGRDPRNMTPAELNALGHHPMPASKAIKAHCVECSGGSAQEAKMCTAVGCNLWPLRFGVSPWKAERQLTDEQMEAARERGRALARKSDARVGKHDGLTGKVEGNAVAAPVVLSPTAAHADSGRGAS